MPWRAGERVVEAMPSGFLSLDADWRITYVNQAGVAILGFSREELVGADFWEVFPANVDNEFGRAYRRAVATGEPVSVEGFYPAPLNRWFEVQAIPAEGGLLCYFSDVTDRRTGRERLAMMARVSAELAGTLDVDSAAARIPRLIVPVLGDWCVLTVLDDDGRPRDVGWWHVDPARRALVERYAAVRLTSMPVTSPVVRALLGETVVAAAGDVAALMPEGEARDLLGLLGPHSGVTLPLRGRGRTLGALTLYFDGDRVMEEADLATAQEVADRAGLALDNVRLFSQQRQLAEELQRSLLTGAFTHDQAEVVVRYTPAAEAARVGGDWYDAFLQPCGATMLVIGDVVGHDTAAAAAMGQLRSLLRGIATYSDAGPGEVLRGLDASMAQLDVGTYATAAVARFEQTPDELTRGVTRMRWSNAGHLPPLVINPDGTLAALADWRGELLLGVDAETSRGESVVTLDGGTTVLLFTDGLIESRGGDLDQGMARLRTAAAELADRSLDELCDELLDRLVHGQPEDDVALVAIRLRG
ncbi:SpoIIE family protein phosphatase [Modestobacter sp. VKM Ac-2979]|uniref:SpoIIE family protein phosphatase n=1 Tax=unclassified Modestobacter TaxID=2643866 RepID=UPI0022ABA9BA|nr:MULTISPECIES: SpoIIE family protein phosphatase [unclassified Modestobacter]MCZ2811068.1 SpoIIE family protein phosphatase [Modestobacter sp. VKM Ac-2979]MCZ2840581.1 SpoIIE family protein phosphatase [Modestobacter sp. VKM Ac-2980]